MELKLFLSGTSKKNKPGQGDNAKNFAMGQSSISKQKTVSKQNNAHFNQNMDMATSQTFLQSFSQSDSQAEDQRNTPVFNKKSYQQAKQMAENMHNRPKSAHPNQHSDYKQQKQFFKQNLKVKWIHILLILRR